jgi:hypothetical protein
MDASTLTANFSQGDLSYDWILEFLVRRMPYHFRLPRSFTAFRDPSTHLRILRS